MTQAELDAIPLNDPPLIWDSKSGPLIEDTEGKLWMFGFIDGVLHKDRWRWGRQEIEKVEMS